VDDIQPLRTHIARLRAKVEPKRGESPRFIVTDPGVVTDRLVKTCASRARDDLPQDVIRLCDGAQANAQSG